jgi:hypothetical protein
VWLFLGEKATGRNRIRTTAIAELLSNRSEPGKEAGSQARKEKNRLKKSASAAEEASSASTGGSFSEATIRIQKIRIWRTLDVIGIT